MRIIRLHLPEYQFSREYNPYIFDNVQRQSIEPVAKQIERAIVDNFETGNILVRGIQSGHHAEMTKQQLVDAISRNGSDIFDNEAEKAIIHAAPYELGIITKILEGFHVYKPKCEEKPQYAVDVWMIFDRGAYENIEYMHPRHHVIVKDRWRQKSDTEALLGVIVID